MDATIGDITFRDIFEKLVIVELPANGVCGKSIPVPSEADAALVYGYIDPQAGLTFDLLAPALFSERKIFHDAAPLIEHNSRVIIRRGFLSDDSRVAFPADVDELSRRYQEHLDVHSRFYQVDESRRLTRDLEEIDHLRNRDFPDDVQVLLFGDDLPMESVWFTLLGFDESGNLVGSLLNEPYANFSVHPGSKMILVPVQDRDGVLVLATKPDMLVD